MSEYLYGLAQFDAFVASCPYFDRSSPVNNNYGCNHPNQEEKTDYAPNPDNLDKNGLDDEGKAPGEYGECHCYCCPYGYNPCSDDIEEAESDGLYLDGLNPDRTEVDNNYLAVAVSKAAHATTEQVEAWVRYQNYLNRYNINWKREDALKPFNAHQKPTAQGTGVINEEMNITIDEALAIIAKRAKDEGGSYDEERTYWWLAGILTREGEEAVMNAARTTPFQTGRKLTLRGYV